MFARVWKYRVSSTYAKHGSRVVEVVAAISAAGLHKNNLHSRHWMLYRADPKADPVSVCSSSIVYRHSQQNQASNKELCASVACDEIEMTWVYGMMDVYIII